MSNSPLSIYVGNQIRNLRITKGFSQQHLAKILNISFQQIQKYEKGNNRVNSDALYQIASALGVSLEEFFPKNKNALENQAIINNQKSLKQLIKFFNLIKDDQLKLQIVRLTQKLSTITQ